MKKIYSMFMIAAMMFVALSFNACSSSDKEDFDEDSIVGVWQCTSFDYSNIFDDDDPDGSIQIGDKIIFKSDGTYSDSEDSGKWRLNGDQLTIVSDDSYNIPVVYTVKKLTSKDLILYIDWGFFDATIKFKRVS